MVRLRQGFRLGQQRALQPACRSTLVQSVLRAGTRQGIPDQFTGPDDIRILHTNGTQRNILQCMGYHPQRMERLFTQDHHHTHHRSDRTDHIIIPSTADIIIATFHIYLTRIPATVFDGGDFILISQRMKYKTCH